MSLKTHVIHKKNKHVLKPNFQFKQQTKNDFEKKWSYKKQINLIFNSNNKHKLSLKTWSYKTTNKSDFQFKQRIKTDSEQMVIQKKTNESNFLFKQQAQNEFEQHM